MCRNIRTLHHFQPPTTPEEVHAAALQYVRKVSGMQKPHKGHEATFEAAIELVAAATTALLETLPPLTTPPRTREGEREKAKLRWEKRGR